MIDKVSTAMICYSFLTVGVFIMFDPKFVARFSEKYLKDKDSGCWNWTASLAGKGYGQIKLPGQRRQIYAHRASYIIHLGEIPDGKNVLHKCDNPKCVNPDHLWIGTQKENLQDMKGKDRHLRGERNNQSMLTEKDVMSIKVLLDKSPLSQAKIANRFGVSQIEVSRIKRGLRWAHIK